VASPEPEPAGADPERSAREVPAGVEAFWVERARSRARGEPTPMAAVAAMVPDVAALSDLFTVARPERFPDYGGDAQAVAYGLWFFPQTWCRARFPILEAIARGWEPPRGREARVLDLCAGSGAAGLSAARLLLAEGAPAVRLLCVDHSRRALGFAEALAREAPPPRGRLDVRVREADLLSDGAIPAGEGDFDLVLLAFGVNEAFAGVSDDDAVRRLARVAQRLAPNGLLVVLEPALRTTAERLRRLAASLQEATSLHAFGPQPFDAPWRPREGGRFWPHEVRAWRCPKSVATLNARLRRSVRELEFSFASLSPAAPQPLGSTPLGPPPLDPSPATFRLTSPLAKKKGRYLATGLATDGTEARYDLLARGVEPDDARRLAGFERGDVLFASRLEPHAEPGSFRILDASDLTRVIGVP
jgi:SAM-dependent methyltransferase